MELYEVEIDTAGDFVEIFVDNCEMFYQVEAKIVTMSGPAGGNPVVRFTGAKSEIWELLCMEYFNYDEKETDWYFDEYARKIK